jgi:hypothetical protein
MAKNKKHLGSNYYPPNGPNFSLKSNEAFVKNNSLQANSVMAPNGATLDLDFTKIQNLDSRFTFSRSSNATFINSQGLVQYADHNLVRNSTFSSLTGWAPTGTGTTTNAGGVLTLSTSAAQTQLYYSQTNAQGFQDNAPVSGRVYSASINITAVSGGITYEELITIAGTFSSVTRYKDGVLVSDGATVSTGLITIVWTSGGSNTLRIGISASGTTLYPSASVSMTLPRCVIGSQTQPTYFESPVASTYHAPRFDYDPTTLTPRGLLIEGSGVNYVLQSGLNPFASPTWQTAGTTPPTVTAGYTGNGFAPDNTSRPTRVQFPVNGGSASRITQGTSYATLPTTAAPYTVSVWMKSNTAGTNYTINILGTDGTGSAPTVTPTWQRFTLVNTSGTSLVGQIYISNNSTSIAADVLIWGAQLEAGSGASSYIPTGTSTVQRAADSCVISGTNFSSWFNATQGTLLTTWSGTGITSGRYATINDGSASNQIWVGYSESAIYNGSFQASFGTAGTANGKVALAYATNDAAWCLSGGAVATDTGVTLPTGLNQIALGNSQAGTAAINTSLKLIKYFPLRLPNATLQSLST